MLILFIITQINRMSFKIQKINKKYTLNQSLFEKNFYYISFVNIKPIEY